MPEIAGRCVFWKSVGVGFRFSDIVKKLVRQDFDVMFGDELKLQCSLRRV